MYHFHFRFPGFPLPFHPVSRVSLPVLSTWLSAGFLSSLPVPLPQPFPWCLPLSGSLRPLLIWPFPFRSAFFRPLSFPSDYSDLCAFLSLHPVFPSQWFFRCLFSPSVTPVSMRSFRFRYSALCSSFLLLPFRLAEGYFVCHGLPFGLAVSP